MELQFFSFLIFAGHASAISREPVSHFLTWLVGARKEFWLIQSYCERRKLPIPISKIFLEVLGHPVLLAKYFVYTAFLHGLQEVTWAYKV